MDIARKSDAEEVFKLYRSYVEHEDELVHQRSTVFITIQSFVLATFGFTYQKKYEVVAKLFEGGKDVSALGGINNEYNAFLLALSLVGVATAFIAWRAVRAAKNAIHALEASWQGLGLGKQAPYLPGLTGGGSGDAARQGTSLATWAPLFLLVLWIVVLGALVFVFDVRVSFRGAGAA